MLVAQNYYSTLYFDEDYEKITGSTTFKSVYLHDINGKEIGNLHSINGSYFSYHDEEYVRIRRCLGIQKMTGPTGQIFKLKNKYLTV